MAERTIRRNSGRASATVVVAGESTPDDTPESGNNSEPDSGESVNTPDGVTLDNYVIDEPVDGNGDTFVDPATGSGSGSDSGKRRKPRSDAGTRRGRPTSRAARATEATGSVANMLFAVHLGLSNLMNSELIALSKEESEAYAKAVTNVSQLYDLPVIGEKALAWTNLVMVMGTIYGPRLVAAKIRKKNSAKKPQVITFETTQHSPQPKEEVS